MKQVEKSGKTVDEAIKAALLELEVSEDQVEVEVLEEPSKGFLGILGNKLAKVRVSVKEQVISMETTLEEKEEVKEEQDPVSRATSFLKGLFEKMGLEVDIQVCKKDEYQVIDFVGPDLGILIGRRGDTLDALQYMVNLVANKNSKERTRFILDVEGYRKRREETLGRLANRLADKVIRKGKDVVLEPMNPHERRIIHTALQDHRAVFTYSEGDEPFRKVVIAPKK